jgi:hydroxylamine reductase
MFCYQCEQTAKGEGCTKVGVCGKQPDVAALQDLLIHFLSELSYCAVEGRRVGVVQPGVDRFTNEGLFPLSQMSTLIPSGSSPSSGRRWHSGMI